MREAKLGAVGSPFGRELRRLRDERNLSLQKLADLVFYSRGYLSKVETGVKPPTAELATRCDQVLEARGKLIALTAADSLPRLAQLPAAAAAFVGRAAQLHQLERTLAGDRPTDTPWAAAIDGPPGAGKTALALRLAHRIKNQFPDGQLYADLRGYSPDEEPASPSSVLEEFLVALGVQAHAIPTRVDRRAALYRSLLDGRRILLVLDNARHSVQIEPLLPGSVGCGVVITSRKHLLGLDMRQDQRLTLEPMTEPESIMLLRTVIGTTRADEDPMAIQSLARRCGYLPLALRIAAERVATHPHHAVDELVEELESEGERLDALSIEDSMAVRTVFSWSYRDLSAEAAQMFRRLGLHRGAHIGVNAAAALAGVSPRQARRLLDRLVSLHLLEGLAGVRYRMHDLLRVYAAERAVAEEPEAERALAIHRVLNWYLHTAYAANDVLVSHSVNPSLDPPDLTGPMVHFTSYDEALAWCEIETPNLVAATRLALEVRQYTIAWKLPVGCWNYVHLRKQWSRWFGAHEIGLVGARRGCDRLGEAWALNNLAHAYRELGRLDDAGAHLHLALDIRRDIGDRLGEAWTLANLGFVDGGRGRLDDAIERYCQALSIFRGIGSGDGDEVPIPMDNRRGEGIVLAYLGNVYRELHRFDDALDYLRQALTILVDIRDRHGEGYALAKLGAIYAEVHRFRNALDCFDQALSICREIGDRWNEAETLYSRGHVLRDSGQLEAAHDSWSQAVAILDEIEDPKANDVRTDLARLTRTHEIGT